MKQSGFVKLLGTSFYYEFAGAGEPVVFLHAGICDGRMWDPQLDWFANKFRVVRYDMRGYGKTAVSPTTYSHHHDLHALLDFLQIKKAHLVGCSLGGSTALDFTLTYPERVNSLTLVCSSPNGYEFVGTLPAQYDDLVAAHKTKDIGKIAALETEIWVVGQQRTPEQVPAHIRNLVTEMNLIAVENEMSGIGDEEALDPTAITRLAEVQADTLVLMGDLDEPDILQASRLMADTIPHAQSTTLPGTAHLPNLEKPQLFNEVLLSFLTNQQ